MFVVVVRWCTMTWRGAGRSACTLTAARRSSVWPASSCATPGRCIRPATVSISSVTPSRPCVSPPSSRWTSAACTARAPYSPSPSSPSGASSNSPDEYVWLITPPPGVGLVLHGSEKLIGYTPSNLRRLSLSLSLSIDRSIYLSVSPDPSKGSAWTERARERERERERESPFSPSVLSHCLLDVKMCIRPAKILPQQSSEFLVWKSYEGPGITRSNVQENRQVKQKPKLLLIHL